MGVFIEVPDFAIGDPGEFVTRGPMIYMIDSNEVIEVPAQFKTDFASIPKAIPRRLFDPMVHGRRAAVVHDFLCRKANAGRSYDARVFADHVFLEALRDTGTGRVRAYLMFAAVRLNTWRMKLTGKLK